MTSIAEKFLLTLVLQLVDEGCPRPRFKRELRYRLIETASREGGVRKNRIFNRQIHYPDGSIVYLSSLGFFQPLGNGCRIGSFEDIIEAAPNQQD